MAFRADLKRALGAPLMDVELDEKPDVNDRNVRDDYDWIEEQVLRQVRPYYPCEWILRKSVPGVGAGGLGQGNIDLSDEDIMTVSECYVIKAVMAQSDVLLPWSLVRIWEKIWVGASEFVGSDLLLYKNELAGLAKASDNVFSWKWYETERKLYIANVPSWANSIGIVAWKGISSIDQADRLSYQYANMLKLAIAFAKQFIGMKLRKYKVEGLDMPGTDYMAEGKELEKEAMEAIIETRHYGGGLS
jgi:hypothetical protein